MTKKFQLYNLICTPFNIFINSEPENESNLNLFSLLNNMYLFIHWTTLYPMIKVKFS